MSKKTDEMLRMILENQCELMLTITQMKRGEFGDGFEAVTLLLRAQQTQRALHGWFMPKPSTTRSKVGIK